MKLYYGWWIVLIAALCTFLDGGIGFYSFGVFYVPLEQEFGWSRAEVSLGMSIYTLVYGGIGFFAGRLTDSRGPRFVMFAGILIMGGALIARSQISQLWQLYVLMAAIGSGVAALGVVPASTVIANWFIRMRGMATGFTMAGIGVGGLVIVPLSQFLITSVGWRITSVVLGIVGIVTVLPLVLLFMRARPAEIGLLPDGDVPDKTRLSKSVGNETKPSISNGHSNSKPHQEAAPDLTLAESLRTPVFWVMTIAYALLMLAASAVLNHEVPYLINQGIDAQAAAAALGVTAGIGAVGKLLSGILADRVGSRLVFLTLSALQAVGVVILLGASDMTTVWVFVAVFGFGMGGAVTPRSMIVAEVFGVRSFGAIFGLLAAFATIGGAIGPYVAGLLFDATKSYQIAMLAVIGAYIIATVLVFFIRPPSRREAQVPEKATLGT